MRKTLLFLLLVPALPAFAGDGDEPAPGASLMRARDADGDGRLSPAEFGPDRELFDLLDRDGDGFLTEKELPRPRKPKDEAADAGERARKQAEKFLRANDKDGDGKIGMSEWPISSRPLADADRNGDQMADLDELTQFFSARRPGKERPPGEAPPRGRPDGPPGAPPGPPPGAEGAPDRPFVREMAEGILGRLDKDGDGKISGDEMPKGGRFDLSRADKNGDGAIDLFEITLVVSERMGQGPGRGEGRWMDRNADAAFRRFDGNEDGKITPEEWKGRPETFQMLDENKDGVITREELTPKGPARMRRGGNRPDVRSGKDSAHFLEKHDSNRDGQVTKEEFPHERRFSEIDTDGNGVLSEAEIKDAMDRMRNEEEYGLFERYDLDGDGKITREEFTGPAAAFERLDKNHDGVIDKSDGE